MSRRPSRTGRRQGSGTKKLSAREQRSREQREEYRSRRKLVQPLVSFTIPATRHPSSAAKLNRYFNYLFGEYGAARGVKIPVRRKDKNKLEKLKERFGQGESQGGLPGIKYVFVPTVHKQDSDDLVRPIIRHRKKGPDLIIFRDESIDDEGEAHTNWEVATQYLPFDKGALLDDADAEVRRVAQELMESMGVTDPRLALFRIQNGDGPGMKQQMSLDRMVADVQHRIFRYSPGNLQKDENPWDEWLDGLIIEIAGAQNDLRDYTRAKQKEADRRKKIGKINLQWANLLNAIDETRRGGGATEVLSQMVNGTVQDAPLVKALLTSMRSRRLVNGDDGFWMMTKLGRDYLSNVRRVLPLFNR